MEDEPAQLVRGYRDRTAGRLHFHGVRLRGREPAIDARGAIRIGIDPDHDRETVTVKGDDPALLGAARREQCLIGRPGKARHLSFHVAQRERQPDAIRQVRWDRIDCLEEFPDVVKQVRVVAAPPDGDHHAPPSPSYSAARSFSRHRPRVGPMLPRGMSSLRAMTS